MGGHSHRDVSASLTVGGVEEALELFFPGGWSFRPIAELPSLLIS